MAWCSFVCAEKKKPLDWSQPAKFSIKLQSFEQNVAAVKRNVKPYIYDQDHTAIGFGATQVKAMLRTTLSN